MRPTLLLLPLAACEIHHYVYSPNIEEAPVDFREVELDARAEAAATVDAVERARAEADVEGCGDAHAWRGGAWHRTVQEALDAVGAGPVVLLCPGVRAGDLQVQDADEVTLAPLGEPLSAALDGAGGRLMESHSDVLGLVELEVTGAAGKEAFQIDADRVVVVDSWFHDATDATLQVWSDEAIVLGTTFEDNRSERGSGAFDLTSRRVSLLDDTFRRNEGPEANGAVEITTPSSSTEPGWPWVLTVQNHFEDNVGGRAGALGVSGALVHGSYDVFRGNHGGEVGALEVRTLSTHGHVELRFPHLEGNGTDGEAAALSVGTSGAADVVLHEPQVIDNVGADATVVFRVDLPPRGNGRDDTADAWIEGGTFARNEAPVTLAFDGPWNAQGLEVGFEDNGGDDVSACGGLADEVLSFTLADDGRTRCGLDDEG